MLNVSSLFYTISFQHDTIWNNRFCQSSQSNPSNTTNSILSRTVNTLQRKGDIARDLSRHPIYPKANPDITTRIYNPVFPTYWQKSSDNYAVKSRDYHCATYTYLGPEWFKAPPKEYQTYKEPLRHSDSAPNVCFFFVCLGWNIHMYF